MKFIALALLAITFGFGPLAFAKGTKDMNRKFASKEGGSLSFSVDCLAGIEKLAGDKLNHLALCVEDGKIIISERANGEKDVTIVSSED